MIFTCAREAESARKYCVNVVAASTYIYIYRYNKVCGGGGGKELVKYSVDEEK